MFFLHNELDSQWYSDYITQFTIKRHVRFLISKWHQAFLFSLLSLREKYPYSELFWSIFSRNRIEYVEILRILFPSFGFFNGKLLNMRSQMNKRITTLPFRICNLLLFVCLWNLCEISLFLNLESFDYSHWWYINRLEISRFQITSFKFLDFK